MAGVFSSALKMNDDMILFIEGFTLFDLFGSVGPIMPGEHYDDSIMTPEWRTASVYFPLPGPAVNESAIQTAALKIHSPCHLSFSTVNPF